MRSLIAWFVKNPVAANLMMFVMFVTGIFGYMNLERENLEREFIPQTTQSLCHGQAPARVMWLNSLLYVRKKLSMD